MKHFIKITGMVLVLASTSAHAQHADHGGPAPQGPSAPKWTQNPVLLATGPRSRTAAKFQAFNIHAMESTAWASFDGHGDEALKEAAQPVKVDDNGALSFKTGAVKGGYYLVRVMGHGPGGEIATATTVKYFSNEAPAPRDMLAAARPGFEIVPDPLPREHGHYRENETWTFHVRMDGKPVTGLPVVLETSNGSTSQFTIKDDGSVDVTFPGDAKEVPKEQWSHGNPPSSNFVLAVRNGGLLATYNDKYNRDAFAGKSVWTGVGFAVLGMIVALPLVRRRKENKEMGS